MTFAALGSAMVRADGFGTALATLDVAHCAAAGDAGASSLIRGVTARGGCPRLVRIEAAGCRAGERTVLEIARAVVACPRLSRVGFGQCREVPGQWLRTHTKKKKHDSQMFIMIP